MPSLSQLFWKSEHSSVYPHQRFNDRLFVYNICLYLYIYISHVVYIIFIFISIIVMFVSSFALCDRFYIFISFHKFLTMWPNLSVCEQFFFSLSLIVAWWLPVK